MASSKQKGPVDYRNAVTGRFRTPESAKRHPNTSEAEHNRPPANPAPKPKGK